ncbi:uncharacterized protein BDV14DRAFT_198918 [Aspergillus stella-maris]|uniref:uncharacterized protein n=1 Tax=Aspergillus stella-maris TaxID=1810926 RepID=UPI003CCD5720
MDSGFQVVGKVPNPNSGLKHFTTASEVATMDFLRGYSRSLFKPKDSTNVCQMRNVLGTPVPKAFSWSSSADNPVGAEYILMELARGVSLNTIWDRLDVDVQFKVLKKIAMYQQVWSNVSFSHYGSLYYGRDLSGQTLLSGTTTKTVSQSLMTGTPSDHQSAGRIAAIDEPILILTGARGAQWRSTNARQVIERHTV